MNESVQELRDELVEVGKLLTSARIPTHWSGFWKIPVSARVRLLIGERDGAVALLPSRTPAGVTNGTYATAREAILSAVKRMSDGGSAAANVMTDIILDHLSRVAPQGDAGSLVRHNAEKDESYCPHCMRCPGIQRMDKVGFMQWKCPACPAAHDARTDAERTKSSEPIAVAVTDAMVWAALHEFNGVDLGLVPLIDVVRAALNAALKAQGEKV